MLNWHPPKPGKHFCPECHGGRKNKRDKSLSVTRDDRGIEVFGNADL